MQRDRYIPHFLSIQYCVCHNVIVPGSDWLKVVFVEDGEVGYHPSISFLESIQGYAHILIHLLYLVILRLGCKVGQHDTVHAEHTVVGPVAMITAIAHILGAVLRICIYRLIYPIPDGRSAEEVTAFHRLPVVHQIT